jgi:hypothetical protein
METNPMAIALVSIIGTILVLLLSLLITMIVNLKRDVDRRDVALNDKIDKIRDRLSEVVLVDNYLDDKKEICLQVKDQEKRIIKLEIQVKVAKDEV